VRFVELVAHDAPGLTPVEARRIFDGVSEAAQLHKASARGLFASEMWSAVEHLVPDSVRISGELTQRNLMNMIVHAYEGDLRFVGLTQKFTGRAKTIFAAKSGGNFAGWFSEKLYTDIKFRANPIFQAQERVEPWVLNGMRGSNPAFGTKATDVDRMTMQEARNLRDSGLIRSTDIDQREMSNQALLGDAVRAEMQRNPSAWSQVSDVQGAKSLNLARTYQANLGQAMRDIFDRYQPGLFDDIVANYSKKGLVSDAEAAARYIAEQRLAGDVELHSVIRPGDPETAFKNAVGMEEMFKPNSFGELRGLNLDYMARALGITTLDKKAVDSAGALRAALADHGSGVTTDRVANALRSYGADEGYIRRVTNALDFHWDGFWRTAASRYNLSAGESRRFQEMFTEAARVRGMTPVDYMSQVFSPMIGGGKDATIEALDSGVSMLRAPKDATSLDFATQVADVFRHHLDPSAQHTLMQAFEKDLPSQINATMQRGAQVTSRNLQKTLSAMRGGAAGSGGAVKVAGWSHDTTAEFARRMTDYMDGKLPTEAFEAITDENRGVASVRQVASSYMESKGLSVPKRAYFPVDEDFSRRTAAAYDALPATGPVEAGPPVTAETLGKATRKLKPTPAGVDSETVRAYQAFVDETIAQYKAIEKAGIRFEPTMGDPYANSAEMVADVRDNKRLRVYAGSAEHPLMTDAQNVMFRGVHDYFAHASEGFQFGPRGEFNAAVKHSQMYSAEARRAMLTETHGQNSFVNFSDRPAADFLPKPEPADRPLLLRPRPPTPPTRQPATPRKPRWPSRTGSPRNGPTATARTTCGARKTSWRWRSSASTCTTPRMP
jgi:hypothetical protein